MDPQQQYCLKWNSYSSNLASSFSNLFKSESLTDVTLLCGDTIFKAHKLILAACSKKFHDMFGTAPSNGPVCVILEATSADNMSALLEFMYKGEVHVSQESLSNFLKAAENLQVKGLSIEHGRLAAHSHGTAPENTLEAQPDRRQQRNNVTGTGALGLNSLKQECDSLMHPSSSGIGGFSPYLPHMYRPLPFDPPRKRHLRSPFTEQETRDSVLRDGSKASTGSISPISKGYRPASSASTTAPSEADTMQTERVSPQQSSYENHSPPSTTAGNGNGTTTNSERNERTERNGANVADPTDELRDGRDSNDNGAEDLRIKMEIKMETDFSPPAARLTSNPNTPQTPTTPVGFGAENSNDPSAPGHQPTAAEMLNVWPASKLANKGGSVNTADGKKLRCPLCERLYGYETNLRAHIRQRHQGIRVPCPFCTRTFTRNNTVRRHIAREHKNELNKQFTTQNQLPNQPPSH